MLATILECVLGHTSEDRGITREFHAIKKECPVCGAPLSTVRVARIPTFLESQAAGIAMATTGWTPDKPTRLGWYWYQEAGTNGDTPMTVWVFASDAGRFALRFASDEPQSFRDPHPLEECPGWWSGLILPL
jgi:hypothetical protein